MRDRTIQVVLSGLFNRLEGLSRAGHPGWDDSCWKHRNEVESVRSRIMDVIAGTFAEDAIPDVLHVTHDHTIYRVDFAQGTLKAFGHVPRHLPCETEVFRVMEVG